MVDFVRLRLDQYPSYPKRAKYAYTSRHSGNSVLFEEPQICCW